jgi:hypothetical protein
MTNVACIHTPRRSHALRARSALAAVLGLTLGFAGCAVPDADPGATAGESEATLALGARGPEVERLNVYLSAHGYFPDADVDARFPDHVAPVAEAPDAIDMFDARTEEAVSELQRRNGLPVTGVVDDATWAFVDAPQCGNPVNALGDDDDKWHHDAQYSSPYALGGTFTYRIVGTPYALSPAQTSAIVRQAFDVWSDARVTFVETSGSADVQIRFTYIDGTGNTLGQTYNNYWGGSRYSIDMDTAENWVPTGDPSFRRPLAHEIGHLLGFDHSGYRQALMYPTTDTRDVPVVLDDDDRGALTSRYRAFIAQPVTAHDIGAGADGVWAIGSVPSGWGFDIKRFNGSSWVTVPGWASRIAVGNEPWIVNSVGTIYRRGGVTASNPIGTTWVAATAGTPASDIGVAAGQNPWIIDRVANGPYGNHIRRWNGSTWQDAGGSAVRIAVGDDGTVIVVNNVGDVWKRVGITASNPIGTGFVHLTNIAPNVFGNDTSFITDVAVSRSGVPWLTGTADGTAMTFLQNVQPAANVGSPYAVALDRWIPLAGNATNIAAWVVDDPWIVGPTGLVSERR